MVPCHSCLIFENGISLNTLILTLKCLSTAFFVSDTCIIFVPQLNKQIICPKIYYVLCVACNMNWPVIT